MRKWNELLTANQRKQWRGIYARGHAGSLVQAYRAAGATHAIFIANAHTADADEAAVSTGGAAFSIGAELGAAEDLSRSLTNRAASMLILV